VPAIGVQGPPPSDEARFTLREGQRAIKSARQPPPLLRPRQRSLGSERFAKGSHPSSQKPGTGRTESRMLPTDAMMRFAEGTVCKSR
jgi:hypothetical protein